MGYEPYATIEDCTKYGVKIPADADFMLRRASRDADTLTFNRINRYGMENLTDFQKELIKEFVCRHAEFLNENQQALESLVNEYSINGVNMKFGAGLSTTTEAGVIVKRALLQLLDQTGLRFRGVTG